MLLTTSISAQRFSASKIKSLSTPPVPCPWYQCSTLFSIKDQITHLRDRRGGHCGKGAQRFSASKIKSRLQSSQCHQRKGVLNAFQHQRSNHQKLKSNVGDSMKCSTLFSIKDQITAEFPTIIPIRDRAQRFSASKIKSPRLMHIKSYRSPVLNAFQHQRSNHKSNSRI